MQLDKKALEAIIALDDAQLKFVINRLAVNAGIDIGRFNLGGNDAQALRRTLSGMTDADLAEAQRQLEAAKRRK